MSGYKGPQILVSARPAMTLSIYETDKSFFILSCLLDLNSHIFLFVQLPDVWHVERMILRLVRQFLEILQQLCLNVV